MKMSQRRKQVRKRNGWNKLFTDMFLKDAPLQSFYKSDAPLNNYDYKCSECGIKGVKLWRYGNSFQINLLCVDCTEEETRKQCKLNDSDPFEKSDQIGYYLPAVPTADLAYEAYWSYTCVPQSGCIWWNNLPLRLENHQTVKGS